MCFVATPRRAKLALGILASMHHSVSGVTRRLVPVEYNQIEATLAAAAADGGGDVNLTTGYSAYPGNTNGILLAMDPYLETLGATGGLVDEFVNPKWADGAKATLSTPVTAPALTHTARAENSAPPARNASLCLCLASPCLCHTSAM